MIPAWRHRLTLAATVLLVACVPAGVFAALGNPLWFGEPRWDRFLLGGAFGYVAALAAMLALPLGPVADGVARRLGALDGLPGGVARGAPATSEVSGGRARNVVEEVAIALGVPAGRVALVDTVVPNVLALPTRSGGLVVVTRGALGLLTRDELAALVASQLVVATSSEVRIASRAQLVEAVSIPAVVVAAFLNPVVVPVAGFALFAVKRRADATRDLIADTLALEATRFPDALVGAFRALRPAALVAPAQRLASAGFVLDPFAVLSARGRSTTTVSVNGRVRRSWSTEDEVAMELGLRAERMERAARGDTSAMRGLGPWRRAWNSLDADGPHALTPAERAKAAELQAALGRLPPPRPAAGRPLPPPGGPGRPG